MLYMHGASDDVQAQAKTFRK